MTKKQKLKLTWINKDVRPRMEPLHMGTISI